MPRVVPQYTIQDPTVSDVKTLVISRQSDGVGGFQTIATAHYELRDGGGGARVYGSVSIALSGPQQTAIGSFITSNILPVIVTQEDL